MTKHLLMDNKNEKNIWWVIKHSTIYTFLVYMLLIGLFIGFYELIIFLINLF